MLDLHRGEFSSIWGSQVASLVSRLSSAGVLACQDCGVAPEGLVGGPDHACGVAKHHRHWIMIRAKRNIVPLARLSDQTSAQTHSAAEIGIIEDQGLLLGNGTRQIFHHGPSFLFFPLSFLSLRDVLPTTTAHLFLRLSAASARSSPPRCRQLAFRPTPTMRHAQSTPACNRLSGS